LFQMFSLFPAGQILGGEQLSQSGSRGDCGRIFCAAETCSIEKKKRLCAFYGGHKHRCAFQNHIDVEMKLLISTAKKSEYK